eukprot:SAG31_NODE_4376_length_3293_cov_15.160301_1_plen_434_part_10
MLKNSCIVCVGSLFGAAHAATILLEGMYGTNEHSSAQDLGSFYATISVGSPDATKQFKVHVDTGSRGLNLPAASCANCVDGAEFYETDGAEMVGCHSPDCDTQWQAEDSAELNAHIAICQLKYPSGFDVCPRDESFRGQAGREYESQGKGRCRIGDGTQVVDPQDDGNAELCADHLACNGGAIPECCPYMQQNGYDCGMDMGWAGHAGNLLSEFCPETCGECGGSGSSEPHGTRYCQNNDNWRDEHDRDCSYYEQGRAGHRTCFDTHAFVACPVSCDACGDCCSEQDGCYFYTSFVDGTAVTGSKYKDTVTLHTQFDQDLSTYGIVQVFNWASDDPQFDPEADFDGIFGLGYSDEYCNPGCSTTLWDSLVLSNGGAMQHDVFALCLSGLHESDDRMLSGKSSWDVGSIASPQLGKYTGSIHYFSIPGEVPGQEG